MIKKIAKQYFKSWSNKDINSLEMYLDENCKLNDWENNLNNKSEILKHNENFFKENKIALKILDIVSEGEIVFADLEITINEEVVSVVDKLTFENNKIIEIKAFLKTNII